MLGLKFRSPSENSPLVPGIFVFLIWLTQNLFLLFGIGTGDVLSLFKQSMPLSLALMIVLIFAVTVNIAFLLKRKFTDFFMSLLLVIVVGFVANFIDKLTAPFKIKNVFGNMAETIKKSGNRKSFGNVTPVHVCDERNDVADLLKCRACFCPYHMDLEVTDNIAECFYRAKNGEYTGEKFNAACSDERTLDTYQRDVTNLFANDNVKTFSVYSYWQGQLSSCREYRVWHSWDPLGMQKGCELNSNFKCVVQDQTNCSVVGAMAVCVNPNINTYNAVKLVTYSNAFGYDGFNPRDCKIAK